ncbi:MAG: ADOP family duplicated permease [Gemmatimonadales bacterium]
MNPFKWFVARRRHQADLAEEIRAHLEEKTEELVRGGMPPAEAALAARRAFGNVTRTQEEGRAVWQWPTLESFAMDLRYALRQLRRSPGLAAAAILTLAIGIAANTTVFSWTRAVLLDPLPGASDASRVVALESLAPSGDWTPTSYLDFRDMRERLRTLESMSVAYPLSLAVGEPGAVERRYGELVSGSFFDVLRIQPEAGRFFAGAERDDAPGAHPVVVLGHTLWATRYHADRAIIGQTILINRYPFTVIGVAPPAFHGSMPGSDFEMWAPATMLSRLDPNGGMFLQDRKTRMFRVLARLRDGVSLEQARSNLHILAAFMAQANASTSKGMSATLLPMWQSHYGIVNHLRAPLVVLLGACGLLLLIVCANLANLLLARATGRRRELSLRLALGAPRSRLVRQLLTEASLLTVTGSVLGLLATFWLSGSLRWLVPSFAAPTLLRPGVDRGVLVFTAALTCGVTLLAGIAPALHGARGQLSDALNEAGRGGTGGAQSGRLRGLLVISEMALAVLSLVGAGLFLKSLQLTRAVQPGFDPDHVAMAQVSLNTAGFDAPHGDAFCRALRERLERQPGVTSASYADYVPLSVGAGSWEDLQVEGYTPGPSENMKLYRSAVAPGYFGVMRIPLLAGRDFTVQDDSAAAPVMIVNEEFVRHFLNGRTAVGGKVHGWGVWFTIVGVAKDIKTLRLTEPPAPYFFVPIRQVYRPEFPFTFFVRTSGSVNDAIAALRRDAQAVDPAVPAFNAMSLAEYIAAPLTEQDAAASLLSILAGVSLALAAIGLYGVMAYSVAQRTKEIGVRLALGAQRSDVFRLVMRQAAALLALGLVLGLGAAVALTRLVSALLFSVQPADPAVYSAAAGFMIAIAILATGIPALRAMRVDPMISLRFE